MLAKIALIAFALVGCGLPQRLDADARTAQMAADAAAEWCEATNGQWCPDVVELGAESDGKIRADDRYSRHDRPAASGGFNDGTDIIMNFERPDIAHELYSVMLHEFGHYAMDHIDEPGHLMSATPCLQMNPDGVHCDVVMDARECIDALSAKRFCDAAGFKGCRSTCE